MLNILKMAKKTQEHKENISKGMKGNSNAQKYEGVKTDKTIYKMCLLGLIDREIAAVLDISEETLNEWKKQYPSVSESIKKGKEVADAKVVQALYKRALGFEYDAVKIFNNNGQEMIVPYKEYVLPDVTAQKKWLAARQRKVWSESLNLVGGQNDDGSDKPVTIFMLPDNGRG